MASISLYPPVVNNTEPAFVVYNRDVTPVNNRGTLRIYFYLSAFSGDVVVDNLSVHAKIFSSKNVKVLNPINGGNAATDDTADGTYRLRGAGVLLNLKIKQDLEMSGQPFYVDIKAEDVQCSWNYYENWMPGWIYKVQLRLSDRTCNINPNENNADRGQEAWMFQYQDHFSEWSSLIYAKAISPMDLSIVNFTDDYQPDGQSPWTPPTWRGPFPTYLIGTLKSGECNGPNEYYESYRIKLNILSSGYNSVVSEVFEDSGDIYATQDSKEKIEYHFKRKLKNITTTYNLNFSYKTINGYEGEEDYFFIYQKQDSVEADLEVYTAEQKKIETINPRYWIELTDIPQEFVYEEVNEIPNVRVRHIAERWKNKNIKYIGETYNVMKDGAIMKTYTHDHYYTFTDEPHTKMYLEIYDTEYYEYDINDQGEFYKVIPPEIEQDVHVPKHTHNPDPRFSVGLDQEEGRISYKIRYKPGAAHPTTGDGINYCIKRASYKDGFEVWTPIHYGYLPPVDDITTIDEYTSVKFDYTVESGVWYQYALEVLDTQGNVLQVNYPGKDEKYVYREFEHSYLLGEGGQQLKIAFDPNINSYSHTVNDVKLETIGSKYAYTSRNTAVDYKMFSIAGTMASQSDPEGIFFDRDKYYNQPYADDGTPLDITKAFDKYIIENNISYRNFTLERDFRNEVLKFLYDGKYKLFKSATEGNIIVRLTEISTSPNQTLSRLVSGFTATANEVDDFTMENCLKYGFYTPKNYQNNEVVIIEQWEVMETPSSEYANKIVQYIGETIEESFEHNAYYICKGTVATGYSWIRFYF